VCQFGCNMPLLYWGETRVASGLTAVLFATVPLTSAFITRALGMERLRPLKIVGGLIALAGVALIGGTSAGDRAHLGGVIAIVVAATMAGLGTALLKRGPKQSPWAANAVGSMVGAPICLIASALLHESWKLPGNGPGWFALFYLVLAGSAGAFALMAWLLHHWPVTRVAFISVATPVIALGLGSVFRHEPVSSRSLAGTLLVMAGLVCGLAADRRPGAKSAGH